MVRADLSAALVLLLLSPGCGSEPRRSATASPAAPPPAAPSAPGGRDAAEPPVTHAKLMDLRPGSLAGRLAYATTRYGAHAVEVRGEESSPPRKLGWGFEPAWSRDGSRIAFVAYDLEGGDEIFVADAAGSNGRRLTTSPGQDRDPQWSPDGSRIAFWSERDGNFEVYVMNADGTDQRRLTRNDGNDQGPAWSPDGRLIAFESYRQGHSDIYVMAPDGTGLRRLTDGTASSMDPAWSPDGAEIAFVQHRGGTWCLCVMKADGTGLRRLTDKEASVRTPVWSPDGAWIAYAGTYKDEGTAEDIYVIDRAGATRSNVTKTADGFEWSPSWTK